MDVSLRGSGAGKCPRYLCYRAQDRIMEPPPSWLMTIFESGNEQEDETIEYLRQQGYEVTDQQRTVHYAFSYGNTTLQFVGHIDGIIGDHQLLEIKAMGKDRYRNIEQGGDPKFTVQAQVALYSLALADTDFPIDSALVVCKRWQQDEWVFYDPVEGTFEAYLDKWERRLRKHLRPVAQFVASADYEPQFTPDGYDCDQCPARYYCQPERLDKEIEIRKEK